MVDAVVRVGWMHWLRPIAAFGRLWAAAVLLPVIALAAAGAWTWNNVMATARSDMARTTDMVHAQVLRGLETQEAVLAAIDAYLSPLAWDQIDRSSAAHAFMRRIAEATPMVETLGAVDPAGFIAVGNESANLPRINLKFRDYVKAWPVGSAPGRTFFSPVTISRTDGRRHVYASRPHLGPDGRSDGGILVATLTPSIFEASFAQVVQSAQTGLSLVLNDGSLLARYPAPVVGEGERMAPDDLAIPALRADPGTGLSFGARGWLLAGGELIVTRPVANYDMHIIHRLDPATVQAELYRQMLSPTLAAVAAMLLLLALTARTQALTLAEQRHLQQRMLSAEANAHAATELATFEARMRQSASIVAIGQMSAGIVHDFNNLLQTILVQSEQARAARSLDVAHRAVSLIQIASERGIGLTRRLLDMTRRESGRPDTVPQRQPQMVEPILSDIAAILSAGALGAGIHLDIAPVSANLPQVKIEAAELEAVLINLLVNARDAMPAGGKILISAIEIYRLPGAYPDLAPGCYVQIEVHDTGVGMNSETLARAGEAFFTTKPSGRGTGLGLSMARGFARDHGGGQILESAEGTGTIVRILLPVA